MTRGIAYRRFQRQKALKRARKKYPKDLYWRNSDKYEEWIKKLANHRTLCSCPICGNPRRHFGTEPLADRRKRLRDEHKIEEVDMS